MENVSEKKILEGGEKGVKIGAKVSFSFRKIGEEVVFAIAVETKLPARGEEDGRRGGNETPLESRTVSVNGVDSFKVCGGLALRGLAEVCLEENREIFL